MSIVKYSSSGTQLWNVLYPNFGNNNFGVAADIALDSSRNVYVTGRGSITPGQANNYMTLKYSQIESIEPISGVVPNRFGLRQNYPNPFNASTRISFEVPRRSLVKIIIYDILGREISTLAQQVLMPGKYRISWYPGVNVSSGIYFCELSSDGIHVSAMQMVFLK